MSAGDFGIVGHSVAVQRLRALIARVGPSHLPALISGPTGAGKELVAQGIHTASRRPGPCVAFNVCALPEGLLEDALFGHVRGAFTGAVVNAPGYLAEADGGTAFFDEIGGLPLALQPKLLRAIETRRFRPVGGRSDLSSDFRVVAATNDDLDALAARGQFRLDLLYRLRGVTIRVPALVEHAEDIPLLARHFLYACTAQGSAYELTGNALRLLMDHSWPGNVRQLRQAIEHAALVAPRGQVGEEEVRLALAEAEPNGHRDPALDLGRHRLLAELERVGWNTAAAAQALGIHRATVYRRMHALGVAPPRRLSRSSFASIRANSHPFAANTRGPDPRSAPQLSPPS